MRPGPMEESASDALKMRADLYAAGDLANVEMVEIDAVEGFKRLLSDGSPHLRRALVAAAMAHTTRN